MDGQIGERGLGYVLMGVLYMPVSALGEETGISRQVDDGK